MFRFNKKPQLPGKTSQQIQKEVFADVEQAIASQDIARCQGLIHSLCLIYNSPGDRSKGQVRRGFNAEELKLVRLLHKFLLEHNALPDEYDKWFKKFADDSEE